MTCTLTSLTPDTAATSKFLLNKKKNGIENLKNFMGEWFHLLKQYLTISTRTAHNIWHSWLPNRLILFFSSFRKLCRFSFNFCSFALSCNLHLSVCLNCLIFYYSWHTGINKTELDNYLPILYAHTHFLNR